MGAQIPCIHALGPAVPAPQMPSQLLLPREKTQGGKKIHEPAVQLDHRLRKKTILQDLIASQLKSMKDWTPQNYTKVRLLDPTKKAPVQLERQVTEALGCPGPFVVSLETLHGGGYPVHRADFVVVSANGDERLGQADLHLQAAGQTWTVVSFWSGYFPS